MLIGEPRNIIVDIDRNSLKIKGFIELKSCAAKAPRANNEVTFLYKIDPIFTFIGVELLLEHLLKTKGTNSTYPIRSQ